MKKDEKPHILFIAPTPPPYAGPEVATESLIKFCKEKKVRITHLRSNVRGENNKKGKFDIEGIKKFLQVYFKIISALIRNKPHKIYFLLSSSRVGFLRDAIIVFTSKIIRKKTIAHYRGGNFHNFYDQQGPCYRWFIRQTLKRIDCLIVQAEILKSIFDGLYPKENIRVLFNGIQLNGNSLLKNIDNDKPFTILFMGHIAFSKGFYELVLSYKQLRRDYPIRLLFAGSPKYSRDQSKTVRFFLSGEILRFFDKHAEHIEQTITRFIKEAEKYDAFYLGIIDGEEKMEAFSAADLFVLPSYTEGFSMAVLEAMGNGLSVVVTPVGAFPEIVREGVNGYFVQPGDSQDLTKKLEYLILNPDKVRCMGSHNRNYVKERFAIEKIVGQLEDILYYA